jgi:hypothetical protein
LAPWQEIEEEMDKFHNGVCVYVLEALQKSCIIKAAEAFIMNVYHAGEEDAMRHVVSVLRPGASRKVLRKWGGDSFVPLDCAERADVRGV